ncbi:hypothetical protein RWE15_04575 [Virgibacillus halophilus]|uniref:Uncharacterized protein n=1 Tax=Tigheibacillus halophilus TaxID=361280 RepID=A0ABU5C3H2_9BACI|nr:hypothetical protein [Virgibacillus halophilus]
MQFIFEDYKKNDAIWSIKYTIFTEDGKPYLRSHVDISSTKKDVAIDYIDVDSFALPDDVEGLFHHPPVG